MIGERSCALKEELMRPCNIFSRALFLLAAIAFAILAGCPSSAETPPRGTTSVQPADLTPEGTEPAKIELSSTAFEPGGPIPAKYTEDGEDVSPPLSWSGVPEGAQELALICDDPDAPSPQRPAANPWVHWVLYKIPPDTQSLPEGIPKTASLETPPGTLQGKNSFHTTGYRGPAPPPGSGTHRYFFKLYALDAALTIEPEVDATALESEMSGHVIGEGRLFGTYAR
jgi:hypothetical protein